MKTTKENTGYKFNKGLILKSAWLLFRESYTINPEKRTNENFNLCLQLAWNKAKVSKAKVLNNNPEIIENESKPINENKIIIKPEIIKPVILIDQNNNTLDFTKVYKENYNSILNTLNFKLNYSDLELAEDLTQETFIKAFENLNKFDSIQSSLNTWLNTIAIRLLINHKIKKTVANNSTNISYFSDNETGKEFFQIADETEQIEPELKEACISETKANLNKNIANLKKDIHKNILNLRYEQKKSYADIAEILNISLSNVKVTLYRAKKELAKKEIIVIAEN